MTARLGELLTICRSKNAGPFVLTFDLVFKTEKGFRRVRDSGIVTPDLVSRLYSVPVDDVRVVAFEPALAIKVVIPRLTGSGAPGDTDVYGAQQHVPLMQLELPASLVSD